MDALTTLRADFRDWSFAVTGEYHRWIAQRFPMERGTYCARLVSDNAEDLREAVLAAVKLDRPARQPS
jgi:hypothetical protein